MQNIARFIMVVKRYHWFAYKAANH